jgi:hypothetical protein
MLLDMNISDLLGLMYYADANVDDHSLPADMIERLGALKLIKHDGKRWQVTDLGRAALETVEPKSSAACPTDEADLRAVKRAALAQIGRIAAAKPFRSRHGGATSARNDDAAVVIERAKSSNPETDPAQALAERLGCEDATTLMQVIAELVALGMVEIVEDELRLTEIGRASLARWAQRVN